MQVELIPVLEVGYHNQGLPSTDKFPTWKYPVEWDTYTALSHSNAGFTTPLVPFAPGMFFYRASEIAIPNLQKIILDHMQGYFDGKWALDDTVTLFGGYVLRLNGQNALFPQCCGELSDIIYWKYLAKHHQPALYHGHPSPTVTFTSETVVLTCHDDFEAFSPPVLAPIRIPQAALSEAYDRALLELKVVATHIQLVQQRLNLPIADLANRLIYRNTEIPNEQP